MSKDISKFRGIWVFVEQRSGELVELCLECLNGGRQLAEKLDTELSAILLGHNVEKLAQELIASGANNVYMVDNPLLEMYQSDAYASVITHLIHVYNPEIFLLGATSIGMDLAPTVAAMVNTGLSAHVSKLEIDENLQLRQIVPGFGGKWMAVVECPKHRPQMATIKNGVFKKPFKDDTKKGNIIKIDVSIKEDDLKAKTIQVFEEKPKDRPLEGSEIVIAGGWGMKSVGDFKPLRELADFLGASVGGTRPAVDEGWIGEEDMIGQSGKTIRPKVYIGLGISGEMHHTIGILNSEYIIAVNKDENAPIFQVADLSILGDLREIIPYLLRKFGTMG
jgi:electron transfer flavoprotein alpha subunit